MPKPAIVHHMKLLLSALLYKLCAKPLHDDVYYVTTPMYHSLALCSGICGSIYTGNNYNDDDNDDDDDNIGFPGQFHRVVNNFHFMRIRIRLFEAAMD